MAGVGLDKTVRPTDIEFVGNFLTWTGHRGAIGMAFALFLLGCLMMCAVMFEWVDIMRPVGVWVLLTVRFPHSSDCAFSYLARDAGRVSSGTP